MLIVPLTCSAELWPEFGRNLAETKLTFRRFCSCKNISFEKALTNINYMVKSYYVKHITIVKSQVRKVYDKPQVDLPPVAT